MSNKIKPEDSYGSGFEALESKMRGTLNAMSAVWHQRLKFLDLTDIEKERFQDIFSRTEGIVSIRYELSTLGMQYGFTFTNPRRASDKAQVADFVKHGDIIVSELLQIASDFKNF